MATGSGPPGHTGPFVSLGSHTVDLRVYPKFREIAAADPSCAPRRRALSWVLKSIDDIYDAYAAAAAAWEQQAQDYLTEPRPPPCETGFPPFVYRFWRKRYGSKALVLQACLELVCCVDLWRTRNSDVELFARLLEEYYTTQELTCIVGLRAALRDVVGVHWKQLWLGGQACIPYARALAAGRAVLGRGRGEVDGAALVKLLYAAMVTFTSAAAAVGDGVSIHDCGSAQGNGLTATWPEGDSIGGTDHSPGEEACDARRKGLSVDYETSDSNAQQPQHSSAQRPQQSSDSSDVPLEATPDDSYSNAQANGHVQTPVPQRHRANGTASGDQRSHSAGSALTMSSAAASTHSNGAPAHHMDTPQPNFKESPPNFNVSPGAAARAAELPLHTHAHTPESPSPTSLDVRGMYNAPPSPPPRHHTSAAHHGAALSTTPPPLPGAPRGSLTAHALALAAAASATPAAERRLSIQASTNQMAAMASPASQRRRSRSPSSTNQQRPSLSPANRRRRSQTPPDETRGGRRGLSRGSPGGRGGRRHLSPQAARPSILVTAGEGGGAGGVFGGSPWGRRRQRSPARQQQRKDGVGSEGGRGGSRPGSPAHADANSAQPHSPSSSSGRDSEPGTDVPDAEDEMADDVIACVFRWEQEYLRAFLPHTHAAADASDVSGGGDGNNGEEEPPPLWHDLPCTLARLREEVLAALVQQAPQLNALAANQLGTATAGRLQAAVNDALVPLRAAIDDPTAHAKVLLNMGRVLDQSTAAGDTQALREAAVCWGEAWGLEPRLTEALFSKAYALHRLGEVDAACACYAKVIEAQPSHSKAWYNLGYLKAELDDQVAAIECFTHAAELSPADAACRVHLGNAYKSLGHDDSAHTCYALALELDPSSVEARYNMGALLQARGDGEGATEHFRRATEIDPLCADAHFNLGIELLAAGDAALAIRCLETVLSIEPDNEDARELASSLAE